MRCFSEKMFEDELGTLNAKCGEIFFRENGCFLFVCLSCRETFQDLNDFEDHISECCLPSILRNQGNDNMTLYEPTVIKQNVSEFQENPIDWLRTGVDKDTRNLSSCEEKYEIENAAYIRTEIESDSNNTDNFSSSSLGLSEKNAENLSTNAFDNSECECDYEFNSALPTMTSVTNEGGARNTIAKAKNSDSIDKQSRFECPVCRKSYPSKTALKTHLYIHSDVRPFQCTMCPQAFKNKPNLSTHIRCHLGDKRFSCDYCEKKFIRNNERLTHMRTHTGEKPYQCNECDLSFKTAGRLSDHKKRHTDTRNFECEICLKRFYSKELLKNHQVCHTTDKPFGCEICLKSFARKKALVSHMKIHSDVKEYVCKICAKAFAQSPGLLCHMKIHEKNQIGV